MDKVQNNSLKYISLVEIKVNTTPNPVKKSYNYFEIDCVPSLTHQFYSNIAEKLVHIDTKVMYKNFMATLFERAKN